VSGWVALAPFTRGLWRSEHMPGAMRNGGRLVVVGGVAAGMSAASRARRLRPDVEIVVLEKGQDVSYGACSTPYYIAGVIEERERLIMYEADFFRRERRIDVRLGAEAVELDARRKSVAYMVDGGGRETIEYDALVVATGAEPIRLPLPGVELPGVLFLRTLEDADAIKGLMNEEHVGRVSILGAGYIGLEMAEAFSARGATVTVFELLPNVLSTYDPDISAVVERHLLDQKVILHKETRVEGFEPAPDSDRVGYVLARGQRIPTDAVLLSPGVRPTTSLAESGGIELGTTGAIRVDARQVTSDPSVLAAGDCCEALHVVTGKPTWIPLGTTANKQGRIAGENAVGGSAKFGGIAGTNVTKVFDLCVAQTGLPSAGAEMERFNVSAAKITAGSRAHTYPGGSPITVKLIFDVDSGRILGAQMVGREGVAKRIDTVAAAIHGRMTVGDLAEVDMSYAPPFAPVWDPVLIAANQAIKKVGRAPGSAG
jgi:NADPH-dependent 2,4-dienoyl-CoA reductase/sulfur reductase-like enzyme